MILRRVRMNIETVKENIMNEYADKNIHKQVLMQLAHLKYWVIAELENEERAKKLGIPYNSSNRKYDDIYEYKEYEKEIEKNGDKNLLVMVNMNKENYQTKGIKPFARRYVHMSYGTYFLVHRTEFSEILVKEDEVEIVR